MCNILAVAVAVLNIMTSVPFAVKTASKGQTSRATTRADPDKLAQGASAMLSKQRPAPTMQSGRGAQCPIRQESILGCELLQEALGCSTDNQNWRLT